MKNQEKNINVVDCHQDLPLWLENNFSGDTVSGKNKYSENIAGVFSAVFPYEIIWDPFNPDDRKIESSVEELIRYWKLLDNFVNQEKWRNYLEQEWDSNGVFCIKHLEGWDHIKELRDIDELLKNWYRSIWLTRNFDNKISGANKSELGLSQFWKEIIQKLNGGNIIIDTAHMSRKWMMEAAKLSKKPIMNSHSGVQEMFDHPRNVTDDFLKAIKDNGWTIWLSPFSWFLKKWQANEEDYIKHIEHVINKIWADHISFWSDFHGIDIKKSVIWNIDQLDEFVKRIVWHFWIEIAKKFFSENIMRVINSHYKQW